MRRFTVLAAVVVAALAVVGVAHAGNPDGLGPWADYVVAHNEGCALQPPDINTCVSVPPSRTDPQAAVGPAESPTGPNQNIPVGSFYSLGFSDQSTGTAFITLGFDNAVCNQPGVDLAIDVFEITQEPYPDETVNVYVSKDNVNYVFAGSVTKDGTVAMPASVPIANFVKLVDATPRGPFASTPIVADGFDLDGVRTLNTMPCDTGTGKIEICKATTNGMSGKLFQYSVNGGTPISVRGGRCSGPVTSPAGAVRIVELQSDPATDVTKVTTRPSNRLVLTDLPNRTAIVFVQPGSTAANETLVTFTNQPAGGSYGNLKICKLTESPVYLGRGFSFSVNGGPLITTEASDAFADPSTYVCRLAGTFQVGTRVSVAEKLPAGAEVAWIDTDPGDRLLDLNTDAATAQVLIGSGVTTLLVDNEPIPPPQAGYIEICKDAALVAGGVPDLVRPGLVLLQPDPEVQGLFTFTVTPSDGNSFDVQAGVGQCTEAIKVAAGLVTVTEHQRANHTLVDAFTIPEDRLLASNLINGTVQVEVPVASSVNDETQVHFVNSRDRAQLKLCKALGPGSNALNNQTFRFSVVDLDGFQRDPLNPSVIASSAGTQCVIVGDFPVGHNVDVKEILNHDPGGDGEFIATSGEGTITIAPGVNSITITNTAMGLLEICKAPIADLRPATTQPKFQFRVDGGGVPVQVTGGQVLAAHPGLGRDPHRHRAQHAGELRARSQRAGRWHRRVPGRP